MESSKRCRTAENFSTVRPEASAHVGLGALLVLFRFEVLADEVIDDIQR